MKLLAIRMAAFRRFEAPAAIEGLTSGINVLAGPNEMGKSTVYRALEAAFMTRFKVSGVALYGMRPYAGGEPLIEVEFEESSLRSTRLSERRLLGSSRAIPRSNSVISTARPRLRQSKHANRAEQHGGWCGRGR